MLEPSLVSLQRLSEFFALRDIHERASCLDGDSLPIDRSEKCFRSTLEPAHTPVGTADPIAHVDPAVSVRVMGAGHLICHPLPVQRMNAADEALGRDGLVGGDSENLAPPRAHVERGSQVIVLE